MFVRDENEEIQEITWWAAAVQSVQTDRVSVLLEGEDSEG